MKRRIRRFSFLNPGRLIVAPKHGLRARSVRLSTGVGMDWHSTGKREELILVVGGRVEVSIKPASGKVRRIRLREGQGVFLPSATMHSVASRLSPASRYVYVTGRA